MKTTGRAALSPEASSVADDDDISLMPRQSMSSSTVEVAPLPANRTTSVEALPVILALVPSATICLASATNAVLCDPVTLVLVWVLPYNGRQVSEMYCSTDVRGRLDAV